MSDQEQAAFASWAILELMGHRRLGGFVREVTLAGAGFFRIDVPGENCQTTSTQFYPPSSLYGLTPVSEDAARAVAKYNRVEPVSVYELPAPPAMQQRWPTCDFCDERHDPNGDCKNEHRDDDGMDRLVDRE